ncbi:MAG TPA: hypothetical protein VLK22_02820 [Candidatus Udaeobacter sp.]|nr:hypothetical protein [Candidatus Udaeobacter sp.]
MLKKITISAIILFSFFISFSASAATTDPNSQLPELNPFCWHRKACETIRKQFGAADNSSGFISDASAAPCTGGEGDDQWGKCLPAGTSKTEISFGGKSEFSNVGEFIVLMYKYLLSIASIVAVIVIVIAGAQWITSGGNSEAISSAKKRIGGAFIGLFIAYMSYFILNTINPALVNLRLPQVWLIRSQSLMPEFCADIEGANSGTIKFMFAAPKETQTTPISTAAAAGKEDGFKWINPKTEPQFACGSRFFAENGGETDCRGDICPIENGNQKSCFSEDGKFYECGDVRLAGRISYTSPLKNCGFFEGAISNQAGDLGGPWDCPPTGKIQLMVVCKDLSQLVHNWGSSHQALTDFLTTLEFGDDGRGTTAEGRYAVSSKASDVINEAMHRCDQFGAGNGADGVKGFVADFNMIKNSIVVGNKPHLIGKGGVDLGRYSAMADSVYKVDQKYLFSLDEIIKGARLDLDVAGVEDSGNEITNKNKAYWESKYR